MVLDDLRQSPYSAWIEFEKVYTNPSEHTKLKREKWVASITYVFRDSVKNNELAVKPLGTHDRPLQRRPVNVWKQPADVCFTDLRTGAGAGLRVRNPFVLFRLDYGLKVNRRLGESRGAFFLSIGQTF